MARLGLPALVSVPACAGSINGPALRRCNRQYLGRNPILREHDFRDRDAQQDQLVSPDDQEGAIRPLPRTGKRREARPHAEVDSGPNGAGQQGLSRSIDSLGSGRETFYRHSSFLLIDPEQGSIIFQSRDDLAPMQPKNSGYVGRSKASS